MKVIFISIGKGFLVGVGILIGMLTIYGAWQSTNPGTSDTDLFLDGDGGILTADKWNALVNKVESNSTGSIPVGTVAAFNLDACPSGWSDYTPAYGRFIRGIDKSGTNIDPDGLRTRGNIQEDDFKEHVHNIGYQIGGTFSQPNTGGGNRGSSTSDSLPAGGDETRPKNVALLYCVKD